MDKCPTDTELQRIDRGENDYADGEWEVCPKCNGSGMYPPGMMTECYMCKGEGEIPKEVQP